jgi:rfaE bifunctional protein nucleotidyltransferase chain/domain
MLESHFYKVEKKELEIIEQNKQMFEKENPKLDYQNSVCIKPWGHEFLAYESKKAGIWCFTVRKHQATSLHCHFKKDTLLIVLSGCAKITFFDGSILSLSTMQSLFIPRTKFHGIGSFSNETTVLEIEIFSDKVSFSDKNDLLRINDIYHRKPIGYESSINLIKEGLEAYGYFSLEEGFSKVVHGVHVELNKFENAISISNKTHAILLDGVVYEDNHLIHIGSMLQRHKVYTPICPGLLLTLTKQDWKEDLKIIHSFEHLQWLRQTLQEQKRSIILTSGCFDIVHIGHLSTLKLAKSLGDTLIVCLSSDEQIRALKGSNRPINCFEDRLNLFKTFECVDYVFPYEEQYIETEETLGSIMKMLDPDYWVKGSDYTVEQIQEKHPYLRKIYLVPLVQNKSTTNIIHKITTQIKE